LKVVHRDLRPDNILINGAEYKIGDFSSAEYALECQKNEEISFNKK
jgi:serine/threonine protein kinase